MEKGGEFWTAVARNDLPKVQRMLRDGRASITDMDEGGYTALLTSIVFGHFSMALWLIEHGGASIAAMTKKGKSAWDFLGSAWDLSRCIGFSEDKARLTAMLRVMVLQGGPPNSLTADLTPELQQIVQDGARLRARLPAYLARRRALLDANCPLLPPLRALVHGYEVPTTTEELWATGLGADP